MDTVGLLERLGLALAIGLLVGIERGWSARDLGDAQRAAGLRTFALTGLLGGVLAALVPSAGPLPLAAGLLVYGAALAAFRWRESERAGTFGVTTVVAGLATYALGASAILVDMAVAAAAGVAMALLLALKGPLHGWVARLTWDELRAGLLLASMTFLALPLLPDRGVGPWAAINPHEVWLLTILICAVSFAGYVAVRVAGDSRGMMIGGAVGGLVSSTAVTVSFARIAGEHPGGARRVMAGAALAGAVMLARVAVVVAILNRDLALLVAPPLLGGALAMAGAAFGMAGRHGAKGDMPSLELRNPFDFWQAVQFGALLALVFLLARAFAAVAGDAGVLLLAAVSGIGDVDAITLSMARLAGTDLTTVAAGHAVLVAVAVNTLAKIAFAWVAGGRAAGAPLALAAAAGFVGASAGFAAAWLLAPGLSS